MGIVYKAEDLRLRAPIALKQTFFSDLQLLKAFEREAHLLNRLRHPALPRVSDYFDEDDSQFLVMEFVEGEDLLHVLEKRQRPFDTFTVLKWADQLLDALHYLHSQEPPIIHRDIKPQNLKLSSREDQIFLLDFGLAKGTLESMTSVAAGHSVLGYTRQYSPFEQIIRADEQWRVAMSVVNQREVDTIYRSVTSPSSDLYSLAATLYHLITGKTPVESPVRALSLWSSKTDPLRPADEVNKEVSPTVAAVLSRAMSIHQSQRHASAAEMREALRNAEAVTAPSDESKKWVKKERPPHVEARIQHAFRTLLEARRKEEESRRPHQPAPTIPSPTVASPNREGVRVVTFPGDRSLGKLYLRERGTQDWICSIVLSHEIGEARGTISIPADKDLLLSISEEALIDLPSLALLHDDDIQAMTLPRVPIRNDSLAHIRGLGGLKTLFAVGISLSDVGLKELQPLKSLEWLNLAHNNITNDGLVSLSQLISLRTLDLTGNRISDEGLKHLCNSVALKWMSLQETRLCDSQLRYLCSMTWLEALKLRSVSLREPQLAKLQGMNNLWYLDVSQNPITDFCLKRLSGFPALQELDLSHTQVSFEGLLQLRDIPSLQQLLIAGIELTSSQLAEVQNALSNCEIGLEVVD